MIRISFAYKATCSVSTWALAIGLSEDGRHRCQVEFHALHDTSKMLRQLSERLSVSSRRSMKFGSSP